MMFVPRPAAVWISSLAPICAALSRILVLRDCCLGIDEALYGNRAS